MTAADGLRLLAERVAAIPAALAALDAEPNASLDLGPALPRWIRVSGLGSSDAHARFLAARIVGELGLPARFEPVSALAPAPADAAEDALVLFSQGISPNVRPLLASADRWRRFVLVTAAAERGDDAKSQLLREARARGARIRTTPGEDEYGTLVRVVGPAIGYVEALRIVEALARECGRPVAPRPSGHALGAATERASAVARRLFEEVGPDAFDRDISWVASGAYAELLRNLAQKVLEGMLRPLPPVWDLLAVAHGPFQQALEHPHTFLAAVHQDDGTARFLLDRLRSMLVPERHRLIVLEAALPGDLAILEHEAMANEFVLGYAAVCGIDPANWPGRGLDGPLYDLDDWSAEVPPAGAEAPPLVPPALASLTWPELERTLASGTRDAVLPLGAIEQHGAHLPFDTDTRIAAALADHLCAEVGEAIRLPVLAVGCSVEHAAFAGTLSIEAGTLEATIASIARSLRAAGFRRLFLFSAHGGNVAIVRDALARLRAEAAPLEIRAFLDLDGLARAMHEVGARDGIAPEEGGHHAGEVETSILLALDPAAVRRDRLAAGFVEAAEDAQALFYPSLRRRVPSGVVGDPRRASADRGRRYLARWVGLLSAAYRAEKNEP